MLLHASCHEASQADDVALLAVRLEAVEPEPMELTLEAEPESLAYMRRVLGRWLRVAGADDDETYEILVACGEACANAVTHAYPGGTSSSSLRRASATAWSRSRSGTSDAGGRAWVRRAAGSADPQLADELELDRAATGTVVRMRRAVRVSPPRRRRATGRELTSASAEPAGRPGCSKVLHRSRERAADVAARGEHLADTGRGCLQEQ